MAILSSATVDEILLSGRAGNRKLNETSVQLDVWKAFAANPNAPIDLLLTPMDSIEASTIAKKLLLELADRPTDDYAREEDGRWRPARRIAPLEGVVAVRLTFFDFLAAVLPSTGLDIHQAIRTLKDFFGLPLARSELDIVPGAGSRSSPIRTVTFSQLEDHKTKMLGRLAPDLRTALLALLILAPQPTTDQNALSEPYLDLDRLLEDLPRRLDHAIYRVSRNRDVHPMAAASVNTIKADAARRVFDISCRGVTWAVIDSGIDGAHPAFIDHAAGDLSIRVKKAYDFGELRSLVAYDAMILPQHRDYLAGMMVNKLDLQPATARASVDRLLEAADNGRPYDWEILSQLLLTRPDRLPTPRQGDRPIGHGTHVAGVLAADWREGDDIFFQGVCPDLMLYDLRVIADTIEDTEFAVIGALEFVRWLNTRNRHMAIHGVNLSIGLVHDKADYACGRTPVCQACEVTVDSGVVVVAAAGNWGAQKFVLDGGAVYDGYADVSIADPGNADSVITVGSTHRDRPHEYGVSFFSSRGPTGDGRSKPDVVAPGERIDGPLPDLGYGRLDGTSMSAPHVSGVAALLMARSAEFIGKPRDVKAVILGTATDLKRERHFQGAGLVDALRALQAR
ncbi:peptidase S8/S53 subtilisin kexin sedolisin [Mesorhizobium sp. M1A.F.Ca.ET.072.01.1.1]|uniref:S8 family peptidase n=1 Tax=Mesorhizobium sp. M1A.F.Ca.ET.072.01.1.1 TaxID=2496753 RepID=UPI000FD20E7E|nr:S8 family peptidase [Mesorhizobium sp. M1A.F.Ca.ET.072.01.1.1]RUW55469.1 peptidase S8/S53 subtilisin kexin sedolisin [Mesorhizobium sp. M1A.F.Ca.ET.072.01.1.1]TIV04620.1 MAG: peptidase S8/S53 subtilisin kexin sedolisin [Mesorhizobium sp.]